MNKKNGLPAGRQGFTLIELLVVIAIIAVLMALAVANYVGARERALDVKKKTEMEQVKEALRLYYNDYQNYPGPSNAPTNNTFSACGSSVPPADNCGDGGEFIAGPTVYMKQLPPSTAYVWHYQAMPVSDDFCLWTTLSNKSDTDIVASQAKCNSACGALVTSGNIIAATDYVQCAD